MCLSRQAQLPANFASPQYHFQADLLVSFVMQSVQTFGRKVRAAVLSEIVLELQETACKL